MAKPSKSWVVTPEDDDKVGLDRKLDIQCPFCGKTTKGVNLFHSSRSRLLRELGSCGHTVIVGPQYLLPWLNISSPQKRFSSILAMAEFADLIILDWVDRHLIRWLDEYTQYRNRSLGRDICFELLIDQDFEGAPSIGVQSVWIHLPSIEIKEQVGEDSYGIGEYEWGSPTIYAEGSDDIPGAAKLSEVFEGMNDELNVSEVASTVFQNPFELI